MNLPRHWPATLLLLVVAAFLIGALTAYWPRLVGDTEDERLAALEAQVQQLGTASAPAAAPAGTQDAMGRRLESIETRLGTLERNAPAIFNPEVGATLDQRMTTVEQKSAADSQALAALIARLNSIEAATPPDLPQRLQAFASRDEVARFEARLSHIESLRHAASVLALARVSRAASDSRPFRQEFEALEAVAPADPAVPALRPFADTSVPTLAMLARSFPQAARNAIAAERTALADGFWDRLWARIRNQFSIRRIVMEPGEDSESRLGRAQIALTEGNLARTVAEVEGLRGAAAESIAPWLRQARARLTIETAVDGMEQRVLQGLAATPVAPQPVVPETVAPAGPAAAPAAPAAGTAPAVGAPAARPQPATPPAAP
jgi:hypothetical protein